MLQHRTDQGDEDAPAPPPACDYAPLVSPRRSQQATSDKDQPPSHPLERAGWLSQLTLWWMNELIFPRHPTGRNSGLCEPVLLQASDLWPLPATDRTANLQDVFNRHYDATRATHTATDKPPPIHSAMWRTTKTTMGPAIALYFLSAMAALIQPLLIKELLEFLDDPATQSSSSSHGFILAALLTLTALVSVSALDAGMFRATRAGIQARTLVVNGVFQKTLLLSSTARQSMTSGEIITLAGVDSERLYEAYAAGSWALVSPVMVAVVCLLIAMTMGPLVGLAAALSAVSILTFAVTNSRRIGQIRRQILAISGERVKQTNEVLQGIRVIKMYAWEDAFLKRMEQIRHKEITLQRKYSYLQAANYVVLTMAQTFMAAACLVVFVYQDKEPLTVPIAFALLAFTNVCRMPFSVFSNAALFTSEAWASMDRISVFLAADQVEIASSDQADTRLPGEPVIEIQQADFGWGSRDHGCPPPPPVLKGINLKVASGTLTIVVGPVGSGKSSLLSALLGEIRPQNEKQGGSCVMRSGRGIAYASQQPWIQHNSVRENILFGTALDQHEYDQVVDACQLVHDFKTLAHGDLTEIGERGINLSGGQKARVSLARVMYRLQRADVLLLDDPLSALDLQVANAVFDQCVVKLASEKTRVVSLNTHYHLLRHADRIVVMADGKIVGDGGYEEMMDKFPHLADRRSQQAQPPLDSSGAEKDQQMMRGKTKDPAGPVHGMDSSDDDENTTTKAASPLMLEEDRATGAITWQTYAAFLAASGWGRGGPLALALCLLFAIGQCGIVACDYFLKYWSNGSLLGFENDPRVLLWLFFALVCLATLLAIVRAVVFTELCIQSSAKMHAKFFQKVVFAPITTFFDVTPVGVILNRFSRDLDQIDNPLRFYGLALLVYLMLTLAILIVCAVTTPVIVLLYGPLWLACSKLQNAFLSISRELKRLDGITRSPFLNLVTETISGLESIRAFGMTTQFAQKAHALIDTNAKVFFLFQQCSNWFVMRLDWLVTSVVVVVAFSVVVWRDSIGAASAGIALTYAVQLTMNFQRLMTRFSSTDNFLTSFERLAHYDTLPEDGQNSSSSKTVDVVVVDADRDATDTSSWPRNGTISFHNVSLRYRDGLDLVLHDVTFSIQHGEKVGICGRTGSGKSTLMGALFRTVDGGLANGRVVIDGVDIASVPVRTLRSKLTVIPQDPVVFSGSLRDNLDPFHVKTDAELVDALRRVCLLEAFVKKSNPQEEEEEEEGTIFLAYEIAEHGANLSVGQRQLLCIARALLRKSKIVLIDEATASVDHAMDQLIQMAIKDNFQNETTVLTIAHRLETILSHSDRVLVMEQGRVVEFDTPATLLAKKNGAFASLLAANAM